jgi:GNAT superfamily N-acetyltransferase
VSTLSWNSLTDDDLPALTHLAQCCLERDGGLPLLSTESMLRQLFLGGASIGGRDETGDLVAVASVFVDGSGYRTASGLIHPSARGQGLGPQLVAWCREHAHGARLRVVAETTSADSDRFFTATGLRRTFAEYVMRHPLVDVPRVRRPRGLHSYPWTADTTSLFHSAHARSFATRPGFHEAPLDAWVTDTESEQGFRPDLSRVALDAGGHVAGFVTISDNWIDQVGVVPSWRGHGLGAHLVVRSLRSLAKAGRVEAWLAVSVDNPAHDLYLRLGFLDSGIRARYEETAD